MESDMKVLRYIRQRMHRDILDHLNSVNLELQKKMEEQSKVLSDSGRLILEGAAQSINQSINQSTIFLFNTKKIYLRPPV